MAGIDSPEPSLPDEVARRRLAVLADLAANPADAWEAVADCVAKAPLDLPFAALYHVDGPAVRLTGTTGVVVPERWHTADVDASGEVVQGLRLSSQADAADRRALLLPIPDGLLLCGLSDRQPLDDDYRRFLLILRRHVGAVAAANRSERDHRVRDEFLGLIGHELRSPMAPILLAVQLIQRQSGDMFGKELAIIDRQSRHLDRLVEDLQDVSRIARGKIELNLTALDLRELLDRVVEMLEPQLEEKSQRVALEVPPGLLVTGDAARLTRIFSSIVAAASRHGGRYGQIAVRGFPEAEDIIVGIQDDGAGGPGRMGVGFSLIKIIVELHGGAVSMERGDPGTQTMVRLPRTTGQQPPARAAEPRPRPRVLVVDDNVDAADVMMMALRSRGYDARTAYDGETALAMSETFLPEVAVLDLSLPGMDGYSLAARMKNLIGADKVRLVALTGYNRGTDTEANREAEFARYFVKPVDVATIDGAIKELLGGVASPPAPGARR